MTSVHLSGTQFPTKIYLIKVNNKNTRNTRIDFEQVNISLVFSNINIRACIYLFDVSNGSNRTMSEICSNVTIKTPE